MNDLQDRLQGAVLGALVGDALGLGPHWYYDLEEMRRDYGEWISEYADPKPGRYHSGMKAGELSQSGLIIKMLAETTAAAGEYDEPEFCRRLDDEILANLTPSGGETGDAVDPYAGPGGFTNQSIRELYRARVIEGREWGSTGDYADTTEAAERSVVLAARHATDPGRAAELSMQNIKLTQIDPAVAAMSTAFGVVVSALIRGDVMDDSLSWRLRDLIDSGGLPFTHTVLAEERGSTESAPAAPSSTLPFPDALLQPGYMAAAAADGDIVIEPAWKASIVYGMPCAIFMQLPAAYYLASRFHDDFESAVLHAVNGGGQNMSRACLTGALVGAQVGRSGIPARFLDGLADAQSILKTVELLASSASR